MNTLQSRARGSMVGLAVGDALGTTVEFESPEQIALRDGCDEWPMQIVGGGPFDAVAGQVTDDTELALALSRALVAKRGYDADTVAQAYVAWRRSQPIDCGAATHRAFGIRETPETDFANHIRARANQETQANGSLMRIAPLGIFGHATPHDTLAQLAASDATLSHPHELCQAAAAVFTVTLSIAIREGLDGKALFERAVTYAEQSELAKPARALLQNARHEAPPFTADKQGWVRVAFETAFFHLHSAKRFDEALVHVVRAGGDTDTNAAVTGALLGAVFGIDAIPVPWRNAVLTCTPPERPSFFFCHDLLELADTLVAIGSDQL